MQTNHLLAATLFALTLNMGAAQAQPVIKDGIVTDPAGRTLYIFDKDQPDTSHCEGGCLKAWPAYAADAAAGAEADPKATRLGTRQWTWNHKPLYYFAGDTQPGDKAGDGSGGVWHIIQPATKATAQTPSASTY
jgi:predicted lipoprotein with Yx(FWY)xxD motif